jgi:DNA-binding response OmpR family regulator
MAGEQILVVEDEAAVARGLIYGLESEGFQVVWAENGQSALDLLQRHDPHLVLLDIRLPDISGFDVCSQIRKRGWILPIIILTARDEEVDKILGLEIGADDYIVKPYSIREVISRIRAQLRRSYGELATQSKGGRYLFDDIVVDFEQYSVLKDGETVSLTPTEFRILRTLIQQQNLPISRQKLLEAIWGYDGEGESERTIDVHIRHLRTKLEEDPAKPRRIITVRGVGYKFQA